MFWSYMRCVLIKKSIWLWTAVDRKINELIGFEIGARDTRHFKNLSEKTSHVDPKKYATDRYASYNLINPARMLIGKAHHYTYCRAYESAVAPLISTLCAKNLLPMKECLNTENSVLFFMKRNLLSSIQF